MQRRSRRSPLRHVLHGAALVFLGLGVGCSRDEEAPSAPSTDNGTRVLRIRRTVGVAGGPKEDSLSVPTGQSVDYTFQPGPGYVSVSVRLDSAAAPSSGTIRMSSDHLLAVGATPSITSAPGDSSLATFLTTVPVAGDPRGAALAASQFIDSLVRALGSAEAIKSAANAVALAATTPLSLARRLRADSAMWNLAIPVSLQGQTTATITRADAHASGTTLPQAAEQFPIDLIYLNGIRLRHEKFLSEIPAFQAMAIGANIPGDVRGSAYYSKTSVLAEAVTLGSDCDVLALIDALESRTDYVDVLRRFGPCIGGDPGQAIARIARAMAPGVSAEDASGAREHVTKSLRGDRAVILVGYSQGALVSQEVIRAIRAANDPKLDAGNCVGFVSVASPFHVDDVVAPSLIAATIAKGAGVKDLMAYMPGPKAAGLTNELATKYDADNARLSDSPVLRSAHEAWSAYHLHDFVDSYQASPLSAAFVQSKLRDVATAVRARCGLGRELAVAPTAVSLTTLTGTNPTPATITISNAGVATIDDLSSSVSYSSQTSGWLTATLNSVTTPTTLTLSAASSTLPAGTYSATVTLASANTAVKNAPVVIPVTLTVTSRPVLMVEPAALGFSATSGSGAQTQVVRVTNAGVGVLGGLSVGGVQYAAGQATGWLTAALDRSTAPASVNVTSTFTSLSPGTYSATIPVQTSQSGVDAAPRFIAVTATVAARPPTLSVSTTALSFSTMTGATAPLTQTIAVDNGGSGTLGGLTLGPVSYDGSGAGWLSASLSSTTAPAVISLNANPSSLSPGVYTATFAVSSSTANVSGSPRTIVVTLNVTASPRPIIAFSSSVPLAFNLTSGTTCPSTSAPPQVSISNEGTGTLNGLSVSASYPAGQPNWLSVTLSGSTAPATINAQPSCAAYGLAAGTYTATVSVSSTAAGVTNSPHSVSATLIVSAPSAATTGSITVSATGIPAGLSASLRVESARSKTPITLVNGQSTTITNLAPDDYIVLPFEIFTMLAPGMATYAPTPGGQAITLKAGSTASASFRYALATGYMRISATGLPGDCVASYSYSGATQSGSGQLISAGGVFAANVPAGTYTVTFGPPIRGSCVGSTLHASPASVTVNVPASLAITNVTGNYVP